MPGAERPWPRYSGATQTPWIWQACEVAAPISALKTTLPSVEAGEGAAGADEFGDPGLVEETAVAGERRDADLLGEHRHARRHDRLHLVLADAADERIGVTSAAGSRSVTMRGWWRRTSRAGPQFGSRSRHSWVVASAGPTMEEQRRPARRARSAKARTASRGGADRDEVGAGVAEASEHAVRVPAPHLAAEAPGVEAGDLDAGGHEGVGDRLAVEDGERGVQVARVEDPGGGLRQHVRGLTMRSADLRTVPGERRGMADARPQRARRELPLSRG